MYLGRMPPDLTAVFEERREGPESSLAIHTGWDIGGRLKWCGAPGRPGGDAAEEGRGASRKGAGRLVRTTGVCVLHLGPSTHSFRCPRFPERTRPSAPPGEWGDQSPWAAHRVRRQRRHGWWSERQRGAGSVARHGCLRRKE